MSIFYKITAPDGKVSYLFGTLHKDTKDIVTLPSEVKQAVEKATDCLFEIDILNKRGISWKINGLAQNWLFAQLKHSSQITKDFFSNAKEYLIKLRDKRVKANLDGESYLNWLERNIETALPLQIAQIMMVEHAPQIEPPNSIDMLDLQLLRYAKSKNKKTAYLESLEEHFTALNGFHLNILEQIELYRFIESELAKGRKFALSEDLENEYLQQQDIQKLYDMAQPFPSTTNVPAPVRRYFDGFIDNRDLKMAEGMKPYLDNGNAFIAVGVCHLKGIIDKLQTGGYTIEAVPLGERHFSIADEEKVAAFRKIYKALYMAQTSFFKKRGFFATDDKVVTLKEIQEYTNANKDSRSYQAWKLAEKHYANISSGNTELLMSICDEGYAKSSSCFGLFRQTKTNRLDPQSVRNARPETRTGIVRDILNGAQI